MYPFFVRLVKLSNYASDIFKILAGYYADNALNAWEIYLAKCFAKLFQ